MKRFAFLFVLLPCVSCANADEHVIFGSAVTVEKSCEVTVKNSDGKEVVFQPGFSFQDECRLVTHDATNIPNIVFINGAYVFFVESNHKSAEGCTSEFTALGLQKNQSLLTTEMIKKSNTCYLPQEQQAFEYFSAKLKPHPSESLGQEKK